ncbi:DNA primase/helicase [Serratia phage vB_SlqS_ZDD2]|nr:DNA primase/helicase [Serratia phage vB_SlqS_ZDD2]
MSQRNRNHDWPTVERAMIGMWKDAFGALTSLDLRTLDGKHHGCPGCGGKDRFRFDNNRYAKGDGGGVCNQCGAGNGLHWFRKATDLDFNSAVNILGDWLNLQPVERIVLAKKEAAAIPDTKFSATMPHQDVEAFMAKCVDYPIHALPIFHGISPEPLMVMEKTVDRATEQKNGKASAMERIVVDTRICVPMTKIGAFPERRSEPEGLLVNVAMIDKDGLVTFPVGHEKPTQNGDVFYPGGKMTYGAVSIIGPNAGRAIYLVADWVDAWHTHYATGAQVWCCYTISNMEQVLHQYQAAVDDGRLRCAVNVVYEELVAAEERGAKVIIPDGGGRISKQRKFKTSLYDPTEIIKFITK